MNDFKLRLLEFREDLFQNFKFRVLRGSYVLDLPRSFMLEAIPDKKKKAILISSREYLGLSTVVPMDNPDQAVELVNDAILTYFDVPRFIANKLPKFIFLPPENLFQLSKKAVLEFERAKQSKLAYS